MGFITVSPVVRIGARYRRAHTADISAQTLPPRSSEMGSSSWRFPARKNRVNQPPAPQSKAAASTVASYPGIGVLGSPAHPKYALSSAFGWGACQHLHQQTDAAAVVTLDRHLPSRRACCRIANFAS